MFAEVKLTVNVAGQNIFITGLLKGCPTLQIVPGLTDDDLAIEPDKRAFVKVEHLDESTIKVSVVTKDSRVLKSVKLKNNVTKVIKIDPWDYI